MRLLTASLLTMFLLTPAWLAAETLTSDQIAAMLLANPPAAASTASQNLADDDGVPDPIIVDFLHADLDRDGSFSYVVALYSTERDPGGFLRVFQQRGSALAVVGDQDSAQSVGGYSTDFHLVDVNGDGVPEVAVECLDASGNNPELRLFIWTGTSLHDMIGGVAGTSALVDIDSDGVLELVQAHDDGTGFDILKLSGGDYRFARSVTEDPTGFLGPLGKFRYVRSFCRRLDPDRVSLADVREAVLNDRPSDESAVHFRFGDLRQIDGSPASVNDVDLATITVQPHLVPTGIKIHQANDGSPSQSDTCQGDFDGGRIDVDVPRQAFLRALQPLQLEAPLAAGDTIAMRLSAKLKDGTPVGAVFGVTIVDDGH
ncbi:MAG TPA: hypothetical protein VLV78_22835 [Thermoanaerobaculia bacterium]|nr:hypothetical protein [Thermoanaerobaculia bacterium]